MQSFPHIVDTPTECHGRPETTTNNSVRVSLRVRPGGPWVSILQSAQEIASGGILRPSSFYSCSLLWNFYFFTWEFGAEPQPCSSVGYGCALQDGVLQAGDQQNRVGGTGAVSRLEAGRNGSIWDCVVSYASCSWKFWQNLIKKEKNLLCWTDCQQTQPILCVLCGWTSLLDFKQRLCTYCERL